MKLIFLSLAICQVFSGSESLLLKSVSSGFTEWMTKFGKSFTNLNDLNVASQNFVINKQRIMAHNEKFNRGEATYMKALNQFSDKLFEDLKETALGLKVPSIINASIPNPLDFLHYEEESVDWRESNLVAPVENQG